jgi:hypothetical protein
MRITNLYVSMTCASFLVASVVGYHNHAVNKWKKFLDAQCINIGYCDCDNVCGVYTEVTEALLNPFLTASARRTKIRLSAFTFVDLMSTTSPDISCLFSSMHKKYFQLFGCSNGWTLRQIPTSLRTRVTALKLSVLHTSHKMFILWYVWSCGFI